LIFQFSYYDGQGMNNDGVKFWTGAMTNLQCRPSNIYPFGRCTSSENSEMQCSRYDLAK
jgi:hypothetical protein